MNRRNEFQGQSGNHATGNQQPDRYRQQEWSDDDERGGNRYRANPLYAGNDEQDDFARGARYASNTRPVGGDYEPSQRGGNYYGGAQDPGYGDASNFGANRGGWSGESQLGGYVQSGNPAQAGNSPQRGNPAQSGYYSQDTRGSHRPQDERYAQQGGLYRPQRDYPPSSGGHADYGRRSMGGSQAGQVRNDFDQAGGYGSGYSQTGSRGDLSSQRGFSGKGPKGYARSDERLKEDICERLTDDYSVDASDIDIAVRNGTVTLSGSVDERWMKHHVEDLVDRCSGVQEIENRLTVSRSRGNASPGASSAPSASATAGSSSTTSPGASSTRKQ
jgi:osmotically-inducible protein OsmY